MRWSDKKTTVPIALRKPHIPIQHVATRGLWSAVVALRSFFLRHHRTAGHVQRVLDRFPSLQDAIGQLGRSVAPRLYEEWIAAYDAISDADIAAMRREAARFAEPPLLSLAVPLSEADDTLLAEFATSLFAQAYERWEVNFVSTAPLNGGLATSVERLSLNDRRFARLAEGSGSVTDRWNVALRSGTSEFVVVVDPPVSLGPHALFLLARTIDREPEVALIYGDEDAMDESGSRSAHYFKPAWNAALLRSQNYLGDLVCINRSRALAVGGFHEALDGDCLWGLLLRLTTAASPDAIHHLPFVLSHRRTERPRPLHAARAHEQRLASIGEPGQVEHVADASYRIRPALPERGPTVSIIVPTTCTLELLRPCMDGLLNRTDYADLEILLVVNGMREGTREQKDFLREITVLPNVRALYFEDRPFNFSETNNWAAEQARGDLLCFLNDDTEVITADWLSAMTGHALRDRVGAVGALLLYPNDRIQHAGVVLGAGGVGAHLYRSMPRGVRGYHDRAAVDQDVSCVTAACVLVRREAFSSIGGFDEKFAVAFNDVDFCLRLQEDGWRIVWTPSAQLYHKESSSFGRHDNAEDQSRWDFEWDLIHRRWGTKLTCDPQYNPNLSLDVLQLWEPAFPPRVSYPWRVRSTGQAAKARIIP
jgi:GT2 family glycosyltransferase